MCLVGKKKVLNYYCKGIDKALFFDPLSRQEAIDCGALPPEKCMLIHWGEDLNFIKEYLKNESTSQLSDSSCSYWISSGKERRDYNTIHYIQQHMPVDKFLYIDPSYSYLECLHLTMNAKGVVVTPNQEGLTYCCGITNILEAFALGKPIIAVKNDHYPFDVEKEGCGFYVNSSDGKRIIELIDMINSDDELYMSLSNNAKRISYKYNMELFGNELKQIIDSL